MQGTWLWALWQELLRPFAAAFTRRGFRRFVEWITGLALNVEEHTITQSLIGLDRAQDWKGLEAFAEYGHWKDAWAPYRLAQLLDAAPGRTWHGYQVSAVDDTKVHRTSKHVWGTCTFHEDTARCPNRAPTVRAPNGVVLGALLHNPGQPAWFLPPSGRLYFRASQLPYQHGDSGPREPFRTKNDWAVALLRQQARSTAGQPLAVFDGAFAVGNVVRPLVHPGPGERRIDFLTRWRQDARVQHLPPPERRPDQRGPTPRWGRRLPPPRQGGRWPGPWQTGIAFV